MAFPNSLTNTRKSSGPKNLEAPRYEQLPVRIAPHLLSLSIFGREGSLQSISRYIWGAHLGPRHPVIDGVGGLLEIQVAQSDWILFFFLWGLSSRNDYKFVRHDLQLTNRDDFG